MSTAITATAGGPQITGPLMEKYKVYALKISHFPLNRDQLHQMGVHEIF